MTLSQPSPPIIAIVGPTAVGKSALALDVARKLGGEIINADSRQVYRGMDVGTAKPSPEERARVPHHLLDVCEPDETFSLALFMEQARAAVEDVQNRGRLPILVGGSGQYVWAFLEGWQVPKVAPNPALRADLELQFQRRGVWPLYQLLQAIDPQTAERTDPQNPRRVLRALEVHLSGGKRTEGNAGRKNAKINALVLGLTMDRKRLYSRIDQRVDEMMRRGFLEEVRRLLDRGCLTSLPAMSGVGYQELAAHLSDDLPLGEAVQRIKFRTHGVARRQYAWFRLEDPRIHWLEASENPTDAALPIARDYLESCAKIVPLGRRHDDN